jgi:hypothetical protein
MDGGIMDETSHQAALGEALERLKERSGRSYQGISRRAFVSKSAVHRYCSGHSVPQEFSPIERIARACHADRPEVDRLYRLWSAVIAARSDTNRVAAIPEPDVEPALPPQREPVLASSPDAGYRRLFSSRARAVGLICAALMAVAALAYPVGRVVVSAERAPTAGRPSSAAPQVIGPAWVLPPARVRPTLFGVTLNSSTGTMPAFDVGAVRLWDSRTRWSQLQPRRGVYDWSVVDRLVGGARRAGLPVLFVAGGTPGWAAPTGPEGPYADSSRAAPPDDLADWDTFVQALATRYRGRIEAYELWVLGNDRRFFSGSVDTLVEMTRRASRIIRATDAAATLVCPGMGHLWTPDGLRSLQRFAELGGYDHCDVAAIKLHQLSAADPPETMLPLLSSIEHTLHKAGAHPRLWSTGTTYSVPLASQLEESRARQYAVRFFLVGLYGRPFNLERVYFYNWGGMKIPIALQAEGGPPTGAALAVARLKQWLAHAQSRTCGHAAAADLPANVWRCELTLVEGDRRRNAAIWWTDSGHAEVPAGPAGQVIHRLDGKMQVVRPGTPITVGEEPVLTTEPVPRP